MKTYMTTLFLMLFLEVNILAQQSHFAIHIYNPLGMFQKAGLKLEWRQKRMGLLLTGIQYYGSLPKYPGTQVGFEGRYYNKTNSLGKHDDFIYSRLFYGNQQHVDRSGDGFFNRAEVPAGRYYGAGIGVGRHFSYGHFFIDTNMGAKLTLSDVGQAAAFYITGPASYLDLHFNIGYQF